jgi:hypothetical protein
MADPFQTMAANFNKSDLPWDVPPEPVVPPVVPAPALSDNYIGRYAFFIDNQGNRNPVGKVIKNENMGGSIKYTTDQNKIFYANQVDSGKVVLEISPPIGPPNVVGKKGQSIFGKKDNKFWGYVDEEQADKYIIINIDKSKTNVFKTQYNITWIWGDEVLKKGLLNPFANVFKPGGGFGGSKKNKSYKSTSIKTKKTKQQKNKTKKQNKKQNKKGCQKILKIN